MSARTQIGRLLVTQSVLDLHICTLTATSQSGPLELEIDEASHADQGLIEITVYRLEAV